MAVTAPRTRPPQIPAFSGGFRERQRQPAQRHASHRRRLGASTRTMTSIVGARAFGLPHVLARQRPVRPPCSVRSRYHCPAPSSPGARSTTYFCTPNAPGDAGGFEKVACACCVHAAKPHHGLVPHVVYRDLGVLWCPARPEIHPACTWRVVSPLRRLAPSSRHRW